jgi:hypothetical protein
MKVFVYFNLHKRCFSIKALEGADKGRVVAHSDALLLHNATFKVSEAGRQRVIREQCKNVHAGVVGDWNSTEQLAVVGTGKAVTYNPYVYDSFVDRETKQPVRQAQTAAMIVANRIPSIYAIS